MSNITEEDKAKERKDELVKISEANMLSKKRNREAVKKHRNNLSAALKCLRQVLPRQDDSKKQKQTCVKDTNDTDETPTFVSSKSRLINRSKDYIIHLESLVSTLINERQNQEYNATEYVCSNSTNTFSRFNSIDDVRRSFLKDFDVDLSIFDYSFDYVKPPANDVSKTNKSSVQIQSDPDPSYPLQDILDLTELCAGTSTLQVPVLDDISFSQ